MTEDGQASRAPGAYLLVVRNEGDLADGKKRAKKEGLAIASCILAPVSQEELRSLIRAPEIAGIASPFTTVPGENLRLLALDQVAKDEDKEFVRLEKPASARRKVRRPATVAWVSEEERAERAREREAQEKQKDGYLEREQNKPVKGYIPSPPMKLSERLRAAGETDEELLREIEEEEEERRRWRAGARPEVRWSNCPKCRRDVKVGRDYHFLKYVACRGCETVLKVIPDGEEYSATLQVVDVSKLPSFLKGEP